MPVTFNLLADAGALPPTDAEMHDVSRQLIMAHIERERAHFSQYITQDFGAYVARKRRDRVHGNHVELQAASEIYNRPVHVYDVAAAAHGGARRPRGDVAPSDARVRGAAASAQVRRRALDAALAAEVARHVGAVERGCGTAFSVLSCMNGFCMGSRLMAYTTSTLLTRCSCRA